MGSKNCPETPRQKMIGVMYLVLTAMLALNVDKAVLDAFTMVDNSMSRTVNNYDISNESIYNAFEMAANENPQKAEKYNKMVKSIKKSSDEITKFIADTKLEIVTKVDGEEANVDSIANKADVFAAEEIMIARKKGVQLKTKIEEYRAELIKLIDPKDKEIIAHINKVLTTEVPNKGKKEKLITEKNAWVTYYFEGYPLAAVITLLTKMETDIKSTEKDMLSYLFTQIDAQSYKFNKLIPQVIPEATYVLQGVNYKSNILLAAIDTTELPVIKIGGEVIPMNKSGQGEYIINTNGVSPGLKSYKGTITYKMPNGTFKDFPFENSYEVAKPSVTISPTKMNVFYLGVDNPVSISVPGVSANDIITNITNGTLTKTNGQYSVKPSKAGAKSVISVSTKINGQTKSLGDMEFRVKKVPDPTARIAKKTGGVISASILAAQAGVVAGMDNFDFDLKFKVQSFNMEYTNSNGSNVILRSKNNRFTAEMKAAIKKLKRGRRVYFEEIKAYGDDKTTRILAPISFKIN